MNQNNSNNTAEMLKRLLNSEEGKTALKRLKGVSDEDLFKKISSADKNAVAERLRLLGMSELAEKINSVSTDDLTKFLAQNPSILKNLLK